MSGGGGTLEAKIGFLVGQSEKYREDILFCCFLKLWLECMELTLFQQCTIYEAFNNSYLSILCRLIFITNEIRFRNVFHFESPKRYEDQFICFYLCIVM